MSNNNNGVVFLATVLSKMSQMFTEINSLYLQAILNKDSITKSPPINTNTPINHSKVESKEEIINQGEEPSSESEQKPQAIVQIPKKQQKNKQKLKASQNKVKLLVDQPPHPPPSSYLLFFQQHRDQIAQQFPNLKVSELSKIASKCWKELTDQQKKPYHLRFNQEKEKYYEALKTYNQSKVQAQTQQHSINQQDKKPKINKNPSKEEAKPRQKRHQQRSPRQENINESDSNDESSLMI